MSKMIEPQVMMMILANPPGFRKQTLIRARDCLFELAERDDDTGRAAQYHRDMLTKEINARN